MVRTYSYCLLMIVFLILEGCQEDDVFLPDIQEIVENNDEYEWRRKQNAWIFTQMRNNYLWADDLKDSLEYDYALEPSAFFESMILPEDRFSYCTRYDGYRFQKKSTHLNATVLLDTIYFLNNRHIGYFVYDEFVSDADITDVVIKFKSRGVDELVVDLRENPGGLLSTCKYLASLILPVEHLGSLFCSCRYNRYLTQELIRTTGSPYEFIYFNSDNLTRKRNLNLERVFFLVNRRSASCSELLINSLRPYMQTVLIGETTIGKDVGMKACYGSKYMYQLMPVTFRAYNASGDSIATTGIVPDIYEETISDIALGNIEEPLLKRALDCIKVAGK